MSATSSVVGKKISHSSEIKLISENEFGEKPLLCAGIKSSLKLKSYDKDHRKYQYLELENGLKVLLIEDSRAKVAASTLYLKVGAQDDPPEHPGLLHFLEHMVFMGSEEFPDEKEFQEFITKNSGYRNGLTYSDHTEFPLSIVHEKFDEALRRFSAFIKAPLLKKSCAQREVKAVHEEFMGCLKEDSRRSYYISTLTINPKHPNHRYFAGNEESLKDLDSIFPKLKSYHHEHYVADRMTLILRSKHTLEELRNFAIKHFSNIRKSEKSAPVITEPTYTQDGLGIKVCIQSAQKSNYLCLLFVQNGPISMEVLQALGYIAYLLKNSQKDGLSDVLKKKGLIQDTLHSGDFSVSATIVDDFQFAIVVSCPLTEDGIKRVDEITMIVLSYFDFLRKEGVKTQYFKELQHDTALKLQMHADTHEPDFFENLKYFDLKYFFTGAAFLEDSTFPEARVLEILSNISPQSMQQIIMLDAPEQDASWKIEPRTKTNTNQTKYKITELCSLVTSWKIDSKEALDIPFKLPEGSEFLPEDFRIKPQSENFRIPRLILNQNSLTVWYSQDLHFKQPTVNTNFFLISHLTRNTIFHTACRRFFITMITPALLRHLSASLKRANANFNIGNEARGIKISFSGYSDKHSNIVLKTFDLLMSFAIDPNEFDLRKKSLIESCKSEKTDRPIEQCKWDVDLLLNSFLYSSEELLKEYEKMSIQHIKEYLIELFENFKLEVYSHGNLLPEEIIELARKVSAKLNINDDRNRVHVPSQGMIVELPRGSNFRLIKKVNQENQAVVVFFQAPDNTQETGGKLMILEKLMRSAFFHQLRTAEQLGYDVGCSSEDIEDYEGLRFHIESSKYSAKFLLKRIELFIRIFENLLDNLTEEEFNVSKKSLQTIFEQFLISPSSSSDYMDIFSSSFENGEYQFEKIFKTFEHFKTIDLSKIQKFYKELTHPSSMRKLVVMTADTVFLPSAGELEQKLSQESLALQSDKDLTKEMLHSSAEIKEAADEKEAEDEKEEEEDVDNEKESEDPSKVQDISKYYLEQGSDSEINEGNPVLVEDVMHLRNTLPCFPDYMNKGRLYLQLVLEFNRFRSEELNLKEGYVEVAPEDLFQALQEVGLISTEGSFSKPTTSSDLGTQGISAIPDLILTYCFDRYRLSNRLPKDSVEQIKIDSPRKQH